MQCFYIILETRTYLVDVYREEELVQVEQVNLFRFGVAENDIQQTTKHETRGQHWSNETG